MANDGNFYVYIVASKTRSIYIGYTNDLERRIYEHKAHYIQGHTAKYNQERLVYVEDYTRADDAIAREKQLKGWRRSKKVALIDSQNPDWNDLSEHWGWTPFEE